MIPKGEIIKTDSGRCLCVKSMIKAGGQGEAYRVTEADTGQDGVLKVFHKRFVKSATVERLRFLIDQDLHSACPVLMPPVDMLSEGSLVGHYTPLAQGQLLEEFLRNPKSTFIEELQLAIALAHAICVLHDREIAHGDLHAENLIVHRIGTALHLAIIDLDNFSAPGIPPPPCIGHNLYMAPELRKALAQERPAVPTLLTDLYSLGVLMHEIILLCHPSAGNDSNANDFQKAMCAGKWLMDPAYTDPGGGGKTFGYPTAILNTDLARLFRNAVSVHPAERPSANRWKDNLNKAFHAVYCCPNPKCGCPCIIDVSKIACPLCGAPYPHLTMRISGHGGAIHLVNGSTVIGRTELGNSRMVSERHAIFHRIGPETWLESVGRNGSYRWSGIEWIRLPDKRSLLVQAGDRLRLGDVEVQLN
ncbi:protein kinase [Candidatus Sumerlaeota bacterium]|nr:protein kinase [Candidatus Sumerlaeota bacterium]